MAFRCEHAGRFDDGPVICLVKEERGDRPLCIVEGCSEHVPIPSVRHVGYDGECMVDGEKCDRVDCNRCPRAERES